MRHFHIGHSAIGLAALAFAGSASAQLADGGFEAQAAGVGQYCYFNLATPGGPPCAAGPWTGTSAGFQNETNIPFPGLPTPDGTQYAFIQNLSTLSQTFTANQTGAFVLSWLDAGRPVNGGAAGNQSYSVTLTDASPLLLGTYATISGQPFAAQTSGAFNLVAGTSYTLTFNGLSTGPDNTAYIDAVSLVATVVPEPHAWAMMLVGFGAIGYALRRRRPARFAQAV